MAKGKQPESEALKAAFELYRNLSETDQQTFRTKEFVNVPNFVMGRVA